ncbi:uridine kinase [Microbacterium invictum]|uniref:Uridine kinase n=1 Tax=Microbacterium invictum TaxID=515415 RepID=A0AA40VMF4_9MICO|nr:MULTISPECIES: uridine kinase [Microbacterium]MBB4139594.1 uridine kinase [Microbacterium invictum]
MRLPITPASTLQRALRDEIMARYRGGRVLVGVDGRDGAGKTVFADGLASVFTETGRAAVRASLDDFHRPRLERYARGRTSPEGHYRDSYDYATFRRVLVDPFLGGGDVDDTGFQLRAFDLHRDAPIEAEWVTAPRDAVLIVDGLFLQRRELDALWHWTIYLDVPPAVAAARMAARDGTDPDPDAASNARYREGFDLYVRQSHPREKANAVIDNTDPGHPTRGTAA